MKRFIYSALFVLAALLFLSAASVFSQTPTVPITYKGDTPETIARRSNWIKAAQKEKEIMWWTSIRPNEIAELGEEFNKIYPFITLKTWRGRDAERGMKIEAEHSIGRLTADLCDAGGMEHYPRWRKIGLVEKFVHIVPGLDGISPRRYSKQMDWIQPGHNVITPLYNTKLVSAAEAPRRWEDLLDSKWKGHIGITSDPKAWYVLALADGGWGIEKTLDFLSKLRKQNLIWAKGHSAGLTLLLAGEYKIFAEGYPRHLFYRKELKNAPGDWVRVSPVPVTGGTFFLTKMAPHPNAARLFLEWVFSPQGAVVFERVTGYGSVDPGSGTRLSKELAGLELVFRDEEMLMKVTKSDIIERIHSALGVVE